MLEKHLREHVRRLCQDKMLPPNQRIMMAFVYDSRRSPKGWPDMVLSGKKGLLFRELKTEKGRLTPEQKDWLLALERHGCNTGIWRPSDLLSGLIAHELGEIR